MYHARRVRQQQHYYNSAVHFKYVDRAQAELCTRENCTHIRNKAGTVRSIHCSPQGLQIIAHNKKDAQHTARMK